MLDGTMPPRHRLVASSSFDAFDTFTNAAHHVAKVLRHVQSSSVGRAQRAATRDPPSISTPPGPVPRARFMKPASRLAAVPGSRSAAAYYYFQSKEAIVCAIRLRAGGTPGAVPEAFARGGRLRPAARARTPRIDIMHEITARARSSVAATPSIRCRGLADARQRQPASTLRRAMPGSGCPTIARCRPHYVAAHMGSCSTPGLRLDRHRRP